MKIKDERRRIMCLVNSIHAYDFDLKQFALSILKLKAETQQQWKNCFPFAEKTYINERHQMYTFILYYIFQLGRCFKFEILNSSEHFSNDKPLAHITIIISLRRINITK